MAELRTWRRVGTAFARLLSAFDRQLRDESGLSLDDFGVLSALSATPGGAMRMAELADRLSFSPSRVSHAVQRMGKLGWITRDHTPDDRRGRLARLTPVGDEVLQAAWPGHAALVRELFLDPLETKQLEELDVAFALISQATIAQRDRPEAADGKS
jgi:DNA-binding MarR family transcriptional regulator